MARQLLQRAGSVIPTLVEKAQRWYFFNGLSIESFLWAGESAVVQRTSPEMTFRLLMRDKCKICKRRLFQPSKRKKVIQGILSCIAKETQHELHLLWTWESRLQNKSMTVCTYKIFACLQIYSQTPLILGQSCYSLNTWTLFLWLSFFIYFWLLATYCP